jgi:hypothetical protein
MSLWLVGNVCARNMESLWTIFPAIVSRDNQDFRFGVGKTKKKKIQKYKKKKFFGVKNKI